jgi:ABC transporter
MILTSFYFFNWAFMTPCPILCQPLSSNLALSCPTPSSLIPSSPAPSCPILSPHTGQLKTSLEHYSGDYQTYQNTLAEKKIVQARAKVAYDKEKEKLKEFISREGRKYDNPAHQSQRKMKLKQLEALVEVESVEEDGELVMIFPTPFGVFDRSEWTVQVLFLCIISVLSCFNQEQYFFPRLFFPPFLYPSLHTQHHTLSSPPSSSLLLLL